MTQALIILTLVVPALMLLACLRRELHDQMIGALWIAPLPGVLAALTGAGGTPVVLDLPQAELVLALDVPGAILLGACALLWMAAGAYAAAYLRADPHRNAFPVRWLLTLLGNLGVFLAGDLLSFFALFALVSLAAYGLVIFDDTPRARRAALIYLVLAVLGEGFLVLGFALLVEGTPSGSLRIAAVVAALPGSPWRDGALALILAGFALKAGLVPLHVWLPIAHPAAPMPASAVLSGALVKAGVIGLIRFLPFGAGFADWGMALTSLGLVTAFYGVAMGVTQDNPKTVLAYSTVSQMGVVSAVLGMGLAGAVPEAAGLAALYAAQHALAKGALFLSLGAQQHAGSRRLASVAIPAAVIALGMAGLPLTGGAVAKLAVKGVLGKGGVGLLASLSAAGTALLMRHFLRRAAATATPPAPPDPGLLWPWWVVAAGAVVVPWALYPGPLSELVSASALWDSAWPVALGLAGALLLERVRDRLPQIPEGDLIVYEEKAAFVAVRWSLAADRLDGLLGRWPVAGVLFVALLVVLGIIVFTAA